MKIAMANDHAGTQLKNQIKAWLEEQGHEVVDFGTYDEEGCDLSDFIYPASKAVATGDCERGIFVDGVGYGSAMIANKFRGVFACVCQDPVCAELASQHNDANVLCIGGKLIGPVLAMAIVKTWMSTDALTAERYANRRRKVAAIDEERTVAIAPDDIGRDFRKATELWTGEEAQALSAVLAPHDAAVWKIEY